MRMQLKIGRNVIFDGALDRINGFARCDAGSVAQTKDMRIDGLCGLTPPHVQNDICGLATDTRQRLKGCAGIGNLTAVLLDNYPAELYDVLGLVSVKTDAFDMFYQATFSQIQHLLWGVRDLEKGARCLVHAHIRGLCGQGNRDDKGVGIDMFQFPFGFGVGGMKSREDFADRMVVKLLCHGDHMLGFAEVGKRRLKSH